MQNFLGQDGFVWWIGVVEDIVDPDTLGRCKVRVFGYHDNEVEIPTEDLPWAVAIHSINTSKLYSPLVVGDWVFGFFLDSAIAQEPAILGVIPTKTAPRSFARVHTANNSSNTICLEFGNNFIEVVNTANDEANGHIQIQHSTGSYIKMGTDGKITVYSANAINFTSNEISFNGNVVSVTGNTVNLTDTSATLTPTGISAGLAAGLVFPEAPAE